MARVWREKTADQTPGQVERVYFRASTEDRQLINQAAERYAQRRGVAVSRDKFVLNAALRAARAELRASTA